MSVLNLWKLQIDLLLCLAWLTALLIFLNGNLYFFWGFRYF